MAQSNLDDSIEKLQQFCGMLTESNAQLEQHAEALDGQGDSLDDLEAGATSTYDALTARLRDLRQELGSNLDDLKRALDELTAVAEAAAETDLPKGLADLEAAEDRFDEGLQEDRDERQQAFDTLIADGFEVLGDAGEEVDGALESADGGSATDFDAFTQAADGLVDRVEAAEATARNALSEAESDLANEEAAELTAAAQQFGEGCGEEAAQPAVDAGEAAVDEAATEYASLGSEGEAEGDALMAAVRTLFQSADEFLTEELGPLLVEAVQEATAGPLQQLDGELQQAAGALAEGNALTEVLGPMVDDLVVVQRVVEQVNRLLDAMGGS